MKGPCTNNIGRFEPIDRPDVPKVETRRSGVAIRSTGLLLARLDAAGIKPSPEADRRTLIRRVYLDLLGLPPTPEEVRALSR